MPSDGEIITYLKPFGDGNGNVVFTRGQQHTIALAVDAAAGSASFWLDGVQIYHGGVPTWVGSYDFSSTQIYCANTLNVRNAAEKTTKSVWKIGRILADSQQPYAFTDVYKRQTWDC